MDCPASMPYFVVHDELYDDDYFNEGWNWWEAAYNCKLVFSAREGLNGKLTVEI